MKILRSPWKNIFLQLVEEAEQSIRITSPFIKSDICSAMIDAKRSSTQIELITTLKLNSVYKGSLDLLALENIINNEGTVKNFPMLHSKIYLFDDRKAIITSGNLTFGGMVRNYEYGILIEDQSIVKNVTEDFDELSQSEKTGVVKQSDLETVKEILSKIPKQVSQAFPSYTFETPEELLDILEVPLEAIVSSLSGWKLEVFQSVNSIPGQLFTLAQINNFEGQLKVKYPQNKHILEKIRQQLQVLRDLGLVEFLGNGKYKKLWI